MKIILSYLCALSCKPENIPDPISHAHLLSNLCPSFLSNLPSHYPSRHIFLPPFTQLVNEQPASVVARVRDLPSRFQVRVCYPLSMCVCIYTYLHLYEYVITTSMYLLVVLNISCCWQLSLKSVLTISFVLFLLICSVCLPFLFLHKLFLFTFLSYQSTNLSTHTPPGPSPTTCGI